MKLFKKKPVVIEALQLTGDDQDIVVYKWAEAFVGSFDSESPMVPARGVSVDLGTGFMLIATLEGVMQAKPGDWIIRGVAGEFYPCKDDIFRATYEPVMEV